MKTNTLNSQSGATQKPSSTPKRAYLQHDPVNFYEVLTQLTLRQKRSLSERRNQG